MSAAWVTACLVRARKMPPLRRLLSRRPRPSAAEVEAIRAEVAAAQEAERG